MKYVNLTSHHIVIHVGDRKKNIPPSGITARVPVAHRPYGTVDNIPVVNNQYGVISGLPDPVEGTIYLVSLMVRIVLGSDRPDVFAPDTSVTGRVWTPSKRISGTKRLIGVCSTEGVHR